jgi:hypothetical protein
MDFQVIRHERNGEPRIYFDMDLDTAWLFAQRIGEVVNAPQSMLDEIREEIY